MLALACCTNEAGGSKDPAAEEPPPASQVKPEPPVPRGPRFLVYAVSGVGGDRLEKRAAVFCKERGATYGDARVFYWHQLGDLPRELGMRDFKTETPPLEPEHTLDNEEDKIYFLLECEPLAK